MKYKICVTRNLKKASVPDLAPLLLRDPSAAAVLVKVTYYIFHVNMSKHENINKQYHSTHTGLNLGWGVSCKACPVPGSDEYAALCPEGAGKDNGGADINECTQVPGVCPHGTCENLEPGYRCICDAGYHPDAAGICRDVDECDMHQSVSDAARDSRRAHVRAC